MESRTEHQAGRPGFLDGPPGLSPVLSLSVSYGSRLDR